ncbi:ankyrin repeat domain-containing protein [bacterium]|nr:ankyrin repeat domain-containing protein [bacterium]
MKRIIVLMQFVCLSFLQTQAQTIPNESIWDAARDGKIESIKWYAQNGHDLNEQNERGLTPFVYAVQSGRRNIIDYLLSQGVDINQQDKHGSTPLIWAGSLLAADDGRLGVYLISKGANINVVTNNGTSALHLAVWYDRKDLVNKLIEKKANLNFVSRSSSYAGTPLDVALRESRLAFAELLKKNGAKTVEQVNESVTKAEIIPYRGHLAFEIKGEYGTSYEIQYSTDNITWQTLETITLQNETTLYLDKTGVGQPKRFYRVKSEG